MATKGRADRWRPALSPVWLTGDRTRESWLPAGLCGSDQHGNRVAFARAAASRQTLRTTQRLRGGPKRSPVPQRHLGSVRGRGQPFFLARRSRPWTCALFRPGLQEPNSNATGTRLPVSEVRGFRRRLPPPAQRTPTAVTTARIPASVDLDGAPAPAGCQLLSFTAAPRA